MGTLKQSRGGEARISVTEFITEEILVPWCLIIPSYEEGETVFFGYALRTTFDFSRLFGVGILRNQNFWSSKRMEKFRLVISACVHLGCDFRWDELADVRDWQLDITVLLLSALISGRNDFGGGLVNAEFWVTDILDDKMKEYTRWVVDHMIPVSVEELVSPCIRQSLSY